MMAANVDDNGREGLATASWWTVDHSYEPRLEVRATPLVEHCIH